MLATLFKSPEEIVQAIHNEFDTAEERLLKEATDLLNEIGIPTQKQLSDKAKRLKNLGFKNAEIVQQHDRILKEEEQHKEKFDNVKKNAELIKYYKETYPFQKFLTEKELDRICNKYNLIYAPVEHYTKDIPDKNLNEIEKAKSLSYSDKVRSTYKIEGFTYSLIQDAEKSWFRSNIKDRIFTTDDPNFTVRSTNRCYYRTPVGDVDLKVSKIEKDGLFIAAPKSHFDLKGLNLSFGLGYFQKTLLVPKDPVVFRYCKGGIQVLSKWGLEANDPLLANGIDN